ncbi:hypothetical protein ACIRBX_00225 [Kitasatospora sp. NPDC096147]|uniref:hypothetical protein n=1 Tax=Kitasatospora sp. NPDC096147 TaxID=3364093 RepID=UPI00381C91FF
MADIYELTLALDLDELSEEELAELRWHLGLGPRPETLRIVTEFPNAYHDDDGHLVIEDEPRPLLAGHGEAFKIDGALVSVLLRRERTTWFGVWALTSRQEIHPDDFDLTGRLLGWLATKAGDSRRNTVGGADIVDLGSIRFYESRRPVPLVVRDGVVIWRP